MAVIAPFLQRQLYDEAVTEMADELRLKADLLESSDSEASAVEGKASRRRQWELPEANGVGEQGQQQVLEPKRSTGEQLRRRKRAGSGPSGPDKVSNWLKGSTDWSRQFLPSSSGAGLGSWASHKRGRESAGVASGVLGGSAAGGGASGGGPTRHQVPYGDFSNWWLRFNLRGRLEEVFPVLPPNTRGRTAWDIFVMALVLYSAVTVPLAFSYGLPHSAVLVGVEWVLTAIYVIDISVNFRTAFYNDDGNIVRDTWPVARRYLMTWFPIDFLSTVPFDTVALAVGFVAAGDSSESQLMVLAVLKTPRLLRLIKLMRLLDRVRNANLFKVMQLILLMMMIAHWLACVWFVIARYSPSRHHWTFDTLDNDSKLTWYLSAFYFSFLLLIGDNIQASNNYERLFFIMALVAGACFYSAVVGNMALLVANMNTVAVRFRQKLDMTQDALRYMRVPEAQRERVQAFYDFITQFSHPGSEGLGFLSELTKGINEDLHIFLHSNTLKRIYLFKDCEHAFIRSLAMRMKIVTFIPGEVIFRQGDLGHEMYIIRAGCVAVVSKNSEVMSLLQAGDFFGEIALLTQARRTAKCIALSNCDLAILKSFDIKILLKEFPQSASRLQEAARERLRQLQIAGRAGTGAGQPDGDGDGDGEDPDTRREREEVRRQRRMEIARFTTGRGVQRPSTPPGGSGDGHGVGGGGRGGDSAAAAAAAGLAAGDGRGSGGIYVDGAEALDGGSSAAAGNQVDSSRNSYTSLATEDSAREFTARRHTNSMTSQGGLSTGPHASVPASRRTSSAGAQPPPPLLGLGRSDTASGGGLRGAGLMVSERPRLRLGSGEVACGTNRPSASGDGAGDGGSTEATAAAAAGGGGGGGGSGGFLGGRTAVHRRPSRNPSTECVALPRAGAATAAASTKPSAPLPPPPSSSSSSWSALFTRRGETRTWPSGPAAPSRIATAEGAASRAASALTLATAAPRAGPNCASDVGASATAYDGGVLGAALEPLTRFDAVERFMPPASGPGALSPTGLSGGSLFESSDGPFARRSVAGPAAGPLAEGVEQIIAPYAKHAAALQARLRPASGAAAAAASAGSGSAPACTAAVQCAEAAAGPMGALAVPTAAGPDARGGSSAVSGRRTCSAVPGEVRCTVAASRGLAVVAPMPRRERRASLVLPHSTTGVADFAAAVAAAMGTPLPPGLAAPATGRGSGAGGFGVVDGAGAGQCRPRQPPRKQSSSEGFAIALAATAASVAFNGAAAAAAAAARGGGGGGAAADTSASGRTAEAEVALAPMPFLPATRPVAAPPETSPVASMSAAPSPLPYNVRHPGAVLRASDGAAPALSPHVDMQSPHCPMRSAAARRADAAVVRDRDREGEQLDSPFALRSLEETFAASSGRPPSPLLHYTASSAAAGSVLAGGKLQLRG